MPNLVDTEFGRRVRAARGYGRVAPPHAEISQQELIEHLEMSDRNLVRRWEAGQVRRGERHMLIGALYELTGLPAEFFEVDFRELITAMHNHPPLVLSERGVGLASDDPAEALGTGEEIDDQAAPAAQPGQQ